MAALIKLRARAKGERISSYGVRKYPLSPIIAQTLIVLFSARGIAGVTRTAALNTDKELRVSEVYKVVGRSL